jgi:hypothetical protein
MELDFVRADDSMLLVRGRRVLRHHWRDGLYNLPKRPVFHIACIDFVNFVSELSFRWKFSRRRRRQLWPDACLGFPGLLRG